MLLDDPGEGAQLTWRVEPKPNFVAFRVAAVVFVLPEKDLRPLEIPLIDVSARVFDPLSLPFAAFELIEDDVLFFRIRIIDPDSVARNPSHRLAYPPPYP